MDSKQTNNTDRSVDEMLKRKSQVVRSRMTYETNKKRHKSRFDYLTITMALLMAAITVIAILISLVGI
ncbi:DUF4044 domain-containing protein [Oenococcus alcoholitolerans]|uniref:DUF4044 domain-containing protein n=1 Tax=Oenococcus alcoholitolerans TaxID=931074 RepID=UPI003F7178A2